jgi:hydroxyacylglutathione hydrolase
MFLRQVFDPHLAQYAYLIGCQRTGEAIVVDPERDVERYRAIAAEEGLKLTAVAETHIHADFVSGARELAAGDPTLRVYVSGEGGADWQSEWAQTRPNVSLLRDGHTFLVGNIRFQAFHTPGHTPEHIIYLVTDLGGGADEPMAMLSGDFLFVGDVGRPDLLEQAAGHAGTQEHAARLLYQSLRKTVSMPDHLQILPGHGAGSACGKSLGSVPFSTLGYERRFNSALKAALHASESEFVQQILHGQPEPPPYFAHMKRLNKVGPAVLGPRRPVPEMSLAQVRDLFDDHRFIVLDTRSKEAFIAGHLRGSLFAPRAKFSEFAGSFLTPGQRVILIAEDTTQAHDYATQLTRIGFDDVVGFLRAKHVISAPAERRTPLAGVSFGGIATRLAQGAAVLDVRKATEFAASHLRGARNIAHTRLLPRIKEVPADQPLLVHCQSGMRATTASAFLSHAGYDVTVVNDQFDNAPRELLEH